MIRPLLPLLGCFLFSVAVACSQQAEPVDLAAGKDLVLHLSPASSPDAAADEAVFRRFGLDRAEKLLFIVVSNGQGSNATADDWAAMHRAFDALIQLNVDQQRLLKASIYAELQDAAYRNKEGDYVAALAAARQAFDLQQRSGETANLSIPCRNVGEDLIQLGRLDEAAAAFYRARQLITDKTGSIAGDLWEEIVSLESSRGNSAAAQRESEAFLHAADDSTPAAFRAEALLASAQVATGDERYDAAASRIHGALHAIEGAANPTLIAYKAIDSLLALGMNAMQTMPYDQALALCEHLDKDFPGLPISISGFAHQVSNHRRRLAGQFDLVLRDDSARLERARAVHDLSGEVAALLYSAVDFSYLRESTQQIAALEQAANILHTPAAGSVSPELRFLLIDSLGAARLDRGNPGQARAAYAEVLTGIEAIASAQTRNQLGNLYAQAKLGMAAVIERDGDFKAARDLLHKSLDPPQGSLGHFTRSTVLLQLAHLEQSANKEPEEAIRLYLEAIAALHREKDLNTEVNARLKLVQFLATSAQSPSNGDLAAHGTLPESTSVMAREQLALARSASTSIALADANWRIQFLQGILDQNAGDRPAAIRSYSAAIDALDHIRAGLSEKEERQSFVDSASVQELYRRQIELLTAGGDRDRAWEFLERNKARSFLEMLHGRRFAPLPSSAGASAATRSSSELDRLEQQIVSARLALSPENEGTLRDSGRLPEVVRANLVSLENNFVLVRQQQTLVASRATQPLALHPISLATTQAQLSPGAALIEYAILDHELAAFVVTHTVAKELHWPADTTALPAQLDKLSRLLSTAHPSEDALNALLASVSELLLAPVVRALPAEIDSLIIVPTQLLSQIPFQALPLPDRSSGARGLSSDEPSPESVDPSLRTLVIDRYAVSYLPSASTLQFLHFGPPAASPDLFLGAIGDLSVEGLPALPGTLDETAGIQKLYPRASRLTGSAFTHDAAVKALLEHQEVHFATHGLFDEEAPLFSALITAPAPGRPSRLSLYELTDLNVKARLVILSACETDRGHVTGGDEIAGLTRTFLQAGAENVVSSLWKVSDESTALLMESLHAHLRAGESTPLALRHAELQVRRKFPEPYFWAAFVDTGVR
jgi:CHAT domain-containing protein/tetratricopeptide (TPR) repeat protein